MLKRYLLVFVVFSSLFLANYAGATEPWPGEVWGQSTILTGLDPDFQKNLSGAHWNNVTGTLWVCINGPGKFWALVDDGNGSFKIDTYNGKAAKWSIPGDIESITQVDLEEPSVYIISEGEDKIRKYDVSVYGTPVLLREWNIAPYVPAYSGGAGSEGITFVPDSWLASSGFVASNGQPYVSKNGMEGLIFIAHQNGGGVYAFDLDPNSSYLSFVGSFKTTRSESSGLEFDRSNGKLYIWHNIGSNFLEITDLTSYIGSDKLRHFTTIKEYYGPKGGNLEGIALTPAASGKNWFFMMDDDNQDGAALMWFKHFVPDLLGNDSYSTYTNTPLQVLLPGVLQNDSGAESLVLVDGPLHGVFQNLDVGDVFDGSFIYNPNTGYSGPDEFRYKSNDGLANSEVATVSLDVKPIKIVDKRITAGIDDVEEFANGKMYTNSTDLELVRDSSVQTVGMRFNSLNIPEESKILKAYIQFATDETTSEATSLMIYGEDIANAAAFTTTARNISLRNKTSTSVSWMPAAWNVINEAGSNQKTPDLNTIVQEIINNSGWQSGNSMVFIINGSGKRVARAFEAAASLAPQLHIEYAEPEETPPIASAIDVKVASSNADAEEFANGKMYINSTDLELVTDTSVQTVGLKFDLVDIPAGAEITNAYIQFAVDETSNTATSLTIYGEESTNPTVFTTASRNISSRDKTAAKVSWSPVAWNVVGEAGTNQQTPDLTDIVQEIINKSGWQAKNSIVFIITGSGKRVAEAFDGEQALAPRLHVEYQ